jgi:hypothetical protein
MRTTGGPAADDGAVTIGIGHMLDCGSIRIADYSVVSVRVFRIGGSRNGIELGSTRLDTESAKVACEATGYQYAVPAWCA